VFFFFFFVKEMGRSEDDCPFVSCSFFMSFFFCDLDILLFLPSWVLFRKRGMNLGAQVFCIIYR